MCMNPAVVGRGTSATVAIEMLGELRRVGAHTFWADEVSAADLAPVSGRLQGFRQVTDAHLALVAATHGGAVATFDRGVAGLVDGQQVLVLEGGSAL
jgi:predicted nucleic acid-binding protein